MLAFSIAMQNNYASKIGVVIKTLDLEGLHICRYNNYISVICYICCWMEKGTK